MGFAGVRRGGCSWVRRGSQGFAGVRGSQGRRRQLLRGSHDWSLRTRDGRLLRRRAARGSLRTAEGSEPAPQQGEHEPANWAGRKSALVGHSSKVSLGSALVGNHHHHLQDSMQQSLASQEPENRSGMIVGEHQSVQKCVPSSRLMWM